MAKRTWELTGVLKKAQLDRTFCTIKQLPILKLMDDRKVVEWCSEVLLDQKTHAETPEHQPPSTSPQILYSILAYRL